MATDDTPTPGTPADAPVRSAPPSPALTPKSDDRRATPRPATGFGDDEPSERDDLAPADLVPAWAMWALMVSFAVLVIAAMDILLSIWPADVTGASAPVTTSILWGKVPVSVTVNDRMMLISVLMGVIGAMVHVMTSFADFVGNGRLAKSWVPWYLLRPVIGSGLALFFYVGFRAGLLTGAGTSTADVINPFGVAAIGGLAGMFSKQATDKLSEVFSTLFKISSTGGDEQRAGKLGKDAPTKPTGPTA